MTLLQALLERSDVRNLLTAQERIVLLRRLLYLNRQLPVAERQDWRAPSWMEDLGSLLLDTGDLAGARAVVAAVPAEVWSQSWRSAPFLTLQFRIAAKAGELGAMLEGYRRNPQESPAFGNLTAAAAALANLKEDSTSNQILAFAYARELDNGNFDSSNFLGLAQIRLKAGDLAGAQQLLHRMQLLSPQPFTDLLPAADLLENYQHKAEAAEYIQARVRAVPWDSKARLRLGADLDAVVADPNAEYQVRVDAAKLGGKGGAGELALLARGAITAAEANRPYYYEARLRAAANTSDMAARTTLLLDAVAVHPDWQQPLISLFQAAYRSGRFELAIVAAQRAPWRNLQSLDQAHELAVAFEQAGQALNAQRVLEEASKEQTSAAVQAQLKLEIAAIARRVEIQSENEARRPHLTASVEQRQVVQPRIEK